MGLDPLVSTLLQVGLLLLAARVGGEIARRLKQPQVAGEIVMGLIVGPSLLGWIHFGGTAALPATFDALASSNSEAVLGFLALLGVLLLLFQVGLESNLAEFRRVGASATLVGFYGVLFSLGAGMLASWAFARWPIWLGTEIARSQPLLLHIFIGATLAATSVGITARILRELGVLASPESQIILAAAVFDDVLGLIVLAVVSGLALHADAVNLFGIAKILVIALAFVAVAIVAGPRLAPRLFDGLERIFKADHALLCLGIVFMLLAAAIAQLAGLAAIVGAFAAGLALSQSKQRHPLMQQIQPVGGLLLSLFFVLLGARVDLRGLGQGAGFAAVVVVVLAIVAIVAKLAAGLGVMRRMADRFVVGIGMVPRGEVGLIFALFGLDNGLIAPWQYAALVLVVLVTTLAAPPWLLAVRGRFTPATGSPPSMTVDMSHSLDH